MSLGGFQNFNLLKMGHFRKYGVEDELESAQKKPRYQEQTDMRQDEREHQRALLKQKASANICHADE